MGSFVVTDGVITAVDRPLPVAAPRVQLTGSLMLDYATIWRTQPQVRTVVVLPRPQHRPARPARLRAPVRRPTGSASRDHPLAVLMAKPNPRTTRYRFIDALVQDLGDLRQRDPAQGQGRHRSARTRCCACLRGRSRPSARTGCTPTSTGSKGSRGQKRPRPGRRRPLPRLQPAGRPLGRQPDGDPAPDPRRGVPRRSVPRAAVAQRRPLPRLHQAAEGRTLLVRPGT